MTNDLKSTIDYHLNKYGKSFERRLGVTKDDLVNDIREQVWKGLVTHKADGGANLKTYLNRVIKNRFKVLLRRSKRKKFASVEFFADVYTHEGVDQEHLVTEETGETLYERRQEMARSLVGMSDTERKILADLVLGFKLNEMAARHKLSMPEVIGAIKRIDEHMKAGNANV